MEDIKVKVVRSNGMTIYKLNSEVTKNNHWVQFFEKAQELCLKALAKYVHSMGGLPPRYGLYVEAESPVNTSGDMENISLWYKAIEFKSGQLYAIFKESQ